MNPLTAMRKTTSLPLLLLGGCASAASPQPAAVETTPVPVNLRPLRVDSARPKSEIVAMRTEACRTNDPMPTGSFRVQPQGHAGLPRGMSMHVPVVPMPNLCPVTVPPKGQVFYHVAPEKRIPQPEPDPREQP
ncbi:MAG TPA: hypothetical protein VHG08_05935 [Longimicrobium sp.]|nr:hypothetical protein [Longimicrobium sp.]